MPLPFLPRGRCSAARRQVSTISLSLRLAVTFVSAVASAAPAVSLAAPPAPSTPPTKAIVKAKPQESYIKASRGVDGNPNSLQTQIRRFDSVHGHGPSIYLVAATHIGEKSYYEQLQHFLDQQDIVLYEGVRRSPTPAKVKTGQATKPHAARVAKGLAAAKESVGIQKKLATALDLQFQLEGIDYDRPQFRNSDMDWETMTTLAKKAGTGTEKALAELGASLNGLNGGLKGQLLNSVLTQAAAHPFLSTTLRGLIIRVLSNPELAQKSATPDSLKLNSILIVERNKVVLTDLNSLLKTSKRNRPKPLHSIALFYGAEHMKNIEQHLVSDLGYRPTNTQWLTAIRATH